MSYLTKSCKASTLQCLLSKTWFAQSWKVLNFRGSPWKVLECHFFLEKSLNFYASPWKVLEFSSTLNVLAWKVFFWCFWEGKQPEIEGDNRLCTSNAPPFACLFWNNAMFLLEIMLIYDPVYDKPLVSGRPTSIKWPLAGTPTVPA